MPDPVDPALLEVYTPMNQSCCSDHSKPQFLMLTACMISRRLAFETGLRSLMSPQTLGTLGTLHDVVVNTTFGLPPPR